MEPVRLIAMDMDGTLLDETQRIPMENLNALREAASRGVAIAICSGRTADDVSFFASDAGLSQCYVLSLNGACCLAQPHGEPYAISTIASEAAARLSDTLLRNQVTFACFQPRRVIVVHGEDHLNKLNWGTHVARDNVNAYAYGETELARHLDEGACKFVYIDRDRDPRIERIRRQLLPIGGLNVTSSWSNSLEIMPDGVNKGVALRSLTEKLGLQPEQVMALGDYDNDLDMIAYAGYGIAMGNASERVKRAAKHITLTNAQHGVAAAIRRFVLNA